MQVLGETYNPPHPGLRAQPGAGAGLEDQLVPWEVHDPGKTETT